MAFLLTHQYTAHAQCVPYSVPCSIPFRIPPFTLCRYHNVYLQERKKRPFWYPEQKPQCSNYFLFCPQVSDFHMQDIAQSIFNGIVRCTKKRLRLFLITPSSKCTLKYNIIVKGHKEQAPPWHEYTFTGAPNFIVANKRTRRTRKRRFSAVGENQSANERDLSGSIGQLSHRLAGRGKKGVSVLFTKDRCGLVFISTLIDNSVSYKPVHTTQPISLMTAEGVQTLAQVIVAAWEGE